VVASWKSPSLACRQPLLPARLLPLRAGLPHRHQQQALRPVGRGLRRRHRRRRHDRPPRPPRRSHRTQETATGSKTATSAASPRPPPATEQHQSQGQGGSVFSRRNRVHIRPPLTSRRHSVPPSRLLAGNADVGLPPARQATALTARPMPPARTRTRHHRSAVKRLRTSRRHPMPGMTGTSRTPQAGSDPIAGHAVLSLSPG
jgi:hypothetical protein